MPSRPFRMMNRDVEDSRPGSRGVRYRVSDRHAVSDEWRRILVLGIQHLPFRCREPHAGRYSVMTVSWWGSTDSFGQMGAGTGSLALSSSTSVARSASWSDGAPPYSRAGKGRNPRAAGSNRGSASQPVVHLEENHLVSPGRSKPTVGNRHGSIDQDRLGASPDNLEGLMVHRHWDDEPDGTPLFLDPGHPSHHGGV